MIDGFVKLYASILTSSIWLESDATLRVWIAMLSTADWEGYVGASVGGLAHVSRVSREDCIKALAVLEAPDPDSRTPDDDGRRIRKVEGGWVVLNIKKYRDMRSPEQIRQAEKKARWRAGKKEGGQSGTEGDSPRCPPETLDVDGDGDKDLTTPPPRAREGQSTNVPESPAAQITGEGLVPREYTPDYRKLMILWPVTGIEALHAEIVALLDGMHGPKVSNETMGRAIRDYVAAFPKQPSLRHFRSFISGIQKETAPPGKQNDGKMLRAGEIIALVKKNRNPQFPNSALPAWRDELSQPEVRAVNAVGVDRILNDKVEGVVLAQLAKMLGEAGA